MLYVMPFLLAMVMTMAWLPIFARYAGMWRIVDNPGLRKVHVTPIPRVGGLAMLVGVLVAAAVVIPLDFHDKSFLAAAVLLAVFGALDDRFDLAPKVKLAGQLIAVLIVVTAGDTQVSSITLDERLILPHWLSLPLTVLFLVGITNAINLADGLDGLAGGTTFLVLGAIAALAHSSGQVVCAALAMGFAGAVLGFLRFNTYPATVFMGDAGSQVLGFAVGVLSLRATQSGASAVSAAIPVLLLALPILDTLSVMMQRLSEGRSPFSADKNHIHHKLLTFGFHHHEAVMVIYAIQADLFILAYWMRYESDIAIIGVVTAFFAGALAVMQGASRRGWRVRTAHEANRDSRVTRILSALRQPQYLPRWCYLAVAGAVGTYAALILSETVSLSNDVQLLVMGLLAVSIILLAVLRVKPLNVVEKAALYVTAAVLVYLDSAILDDRSLATLKWTAIAVAAGGTMLRLRLVPDRRFVLTPLDLLVLFAALVVPSLPGVLTMPNGGAGGIAKLVILFYALEVLVSRVELGVVWLRLAVASLLTGLMLRPLLLP